jgi:hypothetical protein
MNNTSKICIIIDVTLTISQKSVLVILFLNFNTEKKVGRFFLS